MRRFFNRFKVKKVDAKVDLDVLTENADAKPSTAVRLVTLLKFYTGGKEVGKLTPCGEGKSTLVITDADSNTELGGRISRVPHVTAFWPRFAKDVGKGSPAWGHDVATAATVVFDQAVDARSTMIEGLDVQFKAMQPNRV